MEVLSLERLRPPWRISVAGSPPGSSSSTPFVSAPASPSSSFALMLSRSAPSSPPRHGRADFDHSSDLQVAIPFSWEESPGTPKRGPQKRQATMDSDFEFASSLLSCEGRSSMKNSVDHLREMGFTYFSAPTSPGRDDFCWKIHEEKLAKPEEEQERDDGNDSDFEFASKLSEADSVTSAPMSCADELFFKGRILPLKPPPRLQGSAPAAAEDRSASYRTSGATIFAPQSPKSSWKDRKYFGASCTDTNPADLDLLLGMDTSFTKSSHRKEEWMKSLSPLRFFRKDHKAPPRQKEPKPASDGGSKPSNTRSNNPHYLEQRHDFPSKSCAETSTLKNLLHLNGCDASKCIKTDLRLSADALSSNKWYDRSNNRRLENGAERSWPRSSAKSVLHTRSTRASSLSTPSPSNQQQSKNRTKQQQQRGGRGSSGISPHELHYRSYRTSTEQARRTTFLPYKKGLLGCFSFAHFKIPSLSSRLETVVT